MLHSSIRSPRASAASTKIPERASSPWISASTSIYPTLEQGRLGLDPSRRLDAGLVEQVAERDRTARCEVVAVVVEHRVDLVPLAGEPVDRLRPLRELLGRVEPVEALPGVLRV